MEPNLTENGEKEWKKNNKEIEDKLVGETIRGTTAVMGWLNNH